MGKEFQLRRKTSVTAAHLFQPEEAGNAGQVWPRQGSRKARHLLWLQCGGHGRHWSLGSMVDYWVQVTQGLSVILGTLDLTGSGDSGGQALKGLQLARNAIKPVF